MPELIGGTSGLGWVAVKAVLMFAVAIVGLRLGERRTLAQLGADVIRVDPVGGGADLSRWPLAPSGTSLYWTGLNKGKRSVTLNFRAAEGRRLLGDLLAASGPGGGIVLTNAGQEWLGSPALAAICPDLIHLQILGHRDGRAAVDYTVNAETGFPFVTGPLKDKYVHFSALPTPDAYRLALRADHLWLIVMLMAAIGLLTAVKWQSLFPSLADYRAIGWMPVRSWLG